MRASGFAIADNRHLHSVTAEDERLGGHAPAGVVIWVTTARRHLTRDHGFRAELGLTETLKPKTVFTGNGPVSDYLARGDFDLGIQQTNIMVGVPGTEFVGQPPRLLEQALPVKRRLDVVLKGAGSCARVHPVA